MKIDKLINPNINLTANQQAILIVIKISPTPEIAYKNTNINQQTVTARSILKSFGLLKLDINKTALTEMGKKSLLKYALIDESGNLSENGKKIYQYYVDENGLDDNNDSNSDELESFK